MGRTQTATKPTFGARKHCSMSKTIITASLSHSTSSRTWPKSHGLQRKNRKLSTIATSGVIKKTATKYIKQHIRTIRRMWLHTRSKTASTTGRTSITTAATRQHQLCTQPHTIQKQRPVLTNKRIHHILQKPTFWKMEKMRK